MDKIIALIVPHPNSTMLDSNYTKKHVSFKFKIIHIVSGNTFVMITVQIVYCFFYIYNAFASETNSLLTFYSTHYAWCFNRVTFATDVWDETAEKLFVVDLNSKLLWQYKSYLLDSVVFLTSGSLEYMRLNLG